MEYDNKNSFTLFLETEKKSEKSPDYTGTFEDENGKKWRIAGWDRVSKNGRNFISGKVSEQQPKQEVSEKSGYEAFRAAKNNFKKDTVVDFNSDEPINLSDIPF